MEETDPNPNVVYSRDPHFDFGKNVFDGLYRAMSAQHTADAIGDLQLDNDKKCDGANGQGSPLTPLSDDDSPLTPLSEEDELGSRLANMKTSITSQLPTSTSHYAEAMPSPVANASTPSQADILPSVPATCSQAKVLPSALSAHSQVGSSPSILSNQLPASGASPASEPSSRASKRKAQKKEAARRRAKRRKNGNDEYHPDAGLAEKHRVESENIPTQFDAHAFNISSKGYIGVRSPKKSAKTGSQHVDELLTPKYSFELVEWDGNDDRPLSDINELVLGVCISAPRGDQAWEDVHQRAAKAIEKARPLLIFDKKEKQHRRGKFPAVNVGISHGGGQPRPKVLDHDAHNKAILDDLLQEDAFTRISGFTTCAFATWAPRLYEYENRYLNRLIAHDQELRRTNTHPRPQDEPLRRNFLNTPWASTAFNFGPQTICRKHLDSGNLAFGWCVITALGDYDYKKGGHLILWDLKLVIQFPPGTSIMIPSCAIAHSNTRIQPGEKRFSFTQYSAGGIFRWVDNGFKTVEAYMGELDVDARASVLEELANQSDFGLSLYSTLDELRPRRDSE